MNYLFSREWNDLVGRVGGPMTFRLILQPAVAIFLAIRAGLKDAREGRTAFFWAVIQDPRHRAYLLEQGWKDVGRLFILAMLMDAIYQLIVLRWIYPGEMLVVAILLAIVPYLLVRGPTNRIAGRVPKQQHEGEGANRDSEG
jgi:hypothetical protein